MQSDDWLAMLGEGDEVFVAFPNITGSLSCKLVTVTKITKKAIVANESRFNKKTGERIGRKERYAYAPYLVQATETLKARIAIEQRKSFLVYMLARDVDYKAMPLEILEDLASVIRLWRERERVEGDRLLLQNLVHMNPRG